MFKVLANGSRQENETKVLRLEKEKTELKLFADRSLRSNLTKILAKYMSEPILKSRLDYKILILPTSRSKGALEATYALLNFARID